MLLPSKRGRHLRRALRQLQSREQAGDPIHVGASRQVDENVLMSTGVPLRHQAPGQAVDHYEACHEEQPEPSQTDPRTRAVQRAISLLKRGHLGRAAKALLQVEPPRCDEVAIEQMRSLHPSHAPVFPAAPVPAPPGIVVDSDRLHSILKQQATGAAPGPSGWTAELLLTLFEDRFCAEALSSVISAICNGKLPKQAKQWQPLLASRLIGIPKSDHGIRPISIGEALYRLASSYMSDLVAPHFPTIFASIQKGVGCSGGSDRAVHTVQLSLELLKRSCDAVVMSVDIRNAFNSIDRGAVARAIIRSPHAHVLWQFFQWSYSDPSDLLIYDASGNLVTSLQSVQGVKQGDPVSSFMFALTIQSLLEEAVVNLPNMTAVAYLDDVFLVGSGSSVVTAYDRLTQSLPVVGLHVNSQKSSYFVAFLGAEASCAPTS